MKSIFISSTFRDMNEERDLFHRQIAPELNEVARNFGESVSFCDLRWGVDTSQLETEEGAKKVLSVCLDEIDRCKPYMVVLLGERYGWIPSHDLMAQALGGRDNFRLNELEKSVTALEIEYGALSNPERLERTLFYFRQLEGPAPEDYHSEGPDHAAKLASLKQRILTATRGKVKTYRVRWDRDRQRITDLEDFAAMVTRDIRELMEKEWQALSSLSPFQKDLHGQWEMLNQKAAQFTARESLVEECLAQLQRTACYAVQGPTGSGKSTLMSRLGVNLSDKGMEILPIFCGSTPMTGTASDILRYIARYLAEILGKDAPEMPDGTAAIQRWQDYITALIRLYTQKHSKRLIILIDAADQLMAGEDRDQLRFLPQGLCDRVSAVFSCLDSFAVSPSVPKLSIPVLASDDRAAIVRGILAPTGKMLSESIINAIAAKEGSGRPLYLSLLVTRLEMMDQDDFEAINQRGGGIDEINAHQIGIVNRCAQDLDAMCVELLEAASEKLGSDMTFAAAEFFAASRYGLREQDLEGIFSLLGLHWDSLSFSRFRKYMHRFFLQRPDGRIDFAHQAFRRGFLSRTSNTRFHHSILLKHLRSLPENDDVRIREILHHCILADDQDFFISYITEHKSKPQFMTFGASAVMLLAQEDGGQWLCRLLSNPDADCAGYDVNAFILFDLMNAFPARSQQTMVLQKSILEHCIDRCRRVAYLTNKYIDNRNWSVAAHLLGSLLLDLGGEENNITAKELFTLGITIDEKHHRDHPTPRTALDLSVSYDRLARLHFLGRSREGYHRALELYHKSLELRKSILEKAPSIAAMRNLSITYVNIADIYAIRKSAQDLAAARDLYDKALLLRQQICDAEDSPSTRTDFASIQAKIAAFHRSLGTRDDLLKARTLYREAIAIQERIVREDGSPAARISLIVTKGNLILALRNLGSRADLLEALKHGKEMVVMTDALHRELGSNKSLEHYGVSCSRLAGVYRALGLPEDLREALYWFRNALSAREQLAVSAPGNTAQRELASIYSDLSLVCRDLDQCENALNYGKQAVVIYEALVNTSKTPQSRSELSSALIDISITLRRLGGKENLLEGTECCRRALELRRQVWMEQNTSAARRAVMNAMNSLAHMLRSSESAESQAQALELYRGALVHAEALHAMNDTPGSSNDLSSALSYVADMLKMKGGQENLAEAAAAYQKAADLAEALNRSMNSRKSLDDLSAFLIKLGSTYLAMEGIENLTKAYAAYSRAAETQELLDRDTPGVTSKDRLFNSYNRLGEICMKLGGAEQMRKAIAMFSKALAAGQVLEEKTGAEKHIRNNYILMDRIGNLYLKLGNPGSAQPMLEGSLQKRKLLAQKNPAAQTRRELGIGYSSLGALYKSLGGEAKLTESVAMYCAALELFEALVREVKTSGAYNDLIATLYALGIHPAIEAQKRKAYLKRMHTLSMKVFISTQNDKFLKYAATAEKLMKNLPQ